MRKSAFLFLLILFFIGCTFGGNPIGLLNQISSRLLSFNDPELRTCVFDPNYSIVHFPMYHEPNTRNYSNEVYELVTKSQFQLLHTIIDYHRSLRGGLAIFDERVTTDSYDSNYIQSLENGFANSDTYTKLSGEVFYFSERYKTAKILFGQGFPSHYEYLNEPQKQFLFDTGASLTLYFLQEIPKIYKVISQEKFDLVRSNLLGISSNYIDNPQNQYWIFTFRDMELRREVNEFYRQNSFYRGLIFIAYGAKHDFSDDFVGFPFQSGHDFCLRWDRSSPAILP
ncbi:MAG: hypothetical protein OXC37_04765 [Bdellovibrionaceae bacterium]|nr:hypothetical protein [Pseudobdellovibrionaceae bacterium]